MQTGFGGDLHFHSVENVRLGNIVSIKFCVVLSLYNSAVNFFDILMEH